MDATEAINFVGLAEVQARLDGNEKLGDALRIVLDLATTPAPVGRLYGDPNVIRAYAELLQAVKEMHDRVRPLIAACHGAQK